jgi:hypothetical protein
LGVALFFLYLKQAAGVTAKHRRRYMATATMEAVSIPTITRVMTEIGLERRTDDFLDKLDEMELDRRLEISLAQADRGEDRPAEEVVNKVLEDLKAGKVLDYDHR